MLYYDVLDEVAEQMVPNTIHPELHINSREAWIQIMVQLIEYGLIKIGYDDLYDYARKWEQILYKRYSTVN